MVLFVLEKFSWSVLTVNAYRYLLGNVTSSLCKLLFIERKGSVLFPVTLPTLLCSGIRTQEMQVQVHGGKLSRDFNLFSL